MQSKTDPEFERWREDWDELMELKGKHLPDPDKLIDSIAQLWSEPVPGTWKRKDLPLKITERIPYRRGDNEEAQNEHGIEKKICEASQSGRLKLVQKGEAGRSAYDKVVVLTAAYPMAIWKSVEADLVAVGWRTGQPELFIMELKKHNGNNVWHAVVENLRQLKLFKEALESNWKLLRQRFKNALASVPETPSLITGLVLAPPSYYDQPGQKKNAIAPAKGLMQRLRKEGVRIRLAEWREESHSIHLRDE